MAGMWYEDTAKGDGEGRREKWEAGVGREVQMTRGSRRVWGFGVVLYYMQTKHAEGIDSLGSCVSGVGVGGLSSCACVCVRACVASTRSGADVGGRRSRLGQARCKRRVV